MLDDLRSSATEPPKLQPEGVPEQSEPDDKKRRLLLGMTPAQRFIVVLLLLIITCVLGTACLVVFGKINLPFF
jgi:hypothetical protein